MAEWRVGGGGGRVGRGGGGWGLGWGEGVIHFDCHLCTLYIPELDWAEGDATVSSCGLRYQRGVGGHGRLRANTELRGGGGGGQGGGGRRGGGGR